MLGYKQIQEILTICLLDQVLSISKIFLFPTYLPTFHIAHLLFGLMLSWSQ